jgi:hypothetical protein
LWVIFALLDPDPDSEYGSGSTDPIEPGSNSDPDPQPWLKRIILMCRPACRETHNIVEERRVKEEEKSVYEEVEDHDDLFFVQNYDTQADLPHNIKVLLAIFCIFF